MPEQGSRGHSESHFVVLPDCGTALAVAQRAKVLGARTLNHASGRPWLAGRWRDDEITVAAAGDVRLAVIGWCPVGVAELERAAAGLRDLARLDDLTRRLPGSFHLVASLGGRCRVQGTASGLRLVFYRRVDGAVVAADRADVLAGDLPVDEQSLAVRLLFPTPNPLLERTMWRGVECVPPGSALLTDGDRARLTRWWHNPEPVRGLAESAPLIRDALTAAVDVRTRRGGTVASAESGLSSRETEVIGLLLDGATDHQVAARLGMSSRTVRAVAAQLQQRYGTRSRMALGFQLARSTN